MMSLSQQILFGDNMSLLKVPLYQQQILTVPLLGFQREDFINPEMVDHDGKILRLQHQVQALKVVLEVQTVLWYCRPRLQATVAIIVLPLIMGLMLVS
jgi:hypothetical protein